MWKVCRVWRRRARCRRVTCGAGEGRVLGDERALGVGKVWEGREVTDGPPAIRKMRQACKARGKMAVKV